MDEDRIKPLDERVGASKGYVSLPKLESVFEPLPPLKQNIPPVDTNPVGVKSFTEISIPSPLPPTDIKQQPQQVSVDTKPQQLPPTTSRLIDNAGVFKDSSGPAVSDLIERVTALTNMLIRTEAKIIELDAGYRDLADEDYPDDNIFLGLNLSDFAFGILSENGQSIRINSGLISYGLARFSVVIQTVTIGGSISFIILRIDKRQNSASWITASAVPSDSNQFKHIPFYEYRSIEGGPLQLAAIHHVGSVNLV